jgi:hypothetical protein
MIPAALSAGRLLYLDVRPRGRHRRGVSSTDPTCGAAGQSKPLHVGCTCYSRTWPGTVAMPLITDTYVGKFKRYCATVLVKTSWPESPMLVFSSAVSRLLGLMIPLVTLTLLFLLYTQCLGNPWRSHKPTPFLRLEPFKYADDHNNTRLGHHKPDFYL